VQVLPQVVASFAPQQTACTYGGRIAWILFFGCVGAVIPLELAGSVIVDEFAVSLAR
jgi:hypothetical protein